MRPIVVLPLLVALSACAGPDEVPRPTPEPIDGSWQLTSGTLDGGEIPILDEHRITLTSRGAEIGGISACNHYGARIGAEGGGRIRIEETGATEMACEPRVMESEAAYGEALRRVTSLERDGDELVASGDGVELIFRRLPPPPTADLVDKTWLLETLVAGDVGTQPGGEPATLEIRSDGRFSGSTGCRSFAGRWVENANRIDTPEWGLQGECPANLVDQDSHVVTVIDAGFVPALDGDQLTIADPSGDALIYGASE